LDKIEALQSEHENFVPDDKFLRRIPWWHLKPSGEISSAAFQNDAATNSFSTNWNKLSSEEKTLENFPGFGLVSITAKLSWDLGQEIEWNPLDDNTAHCEIVGHKTESICKKFRNGAEPLRYPKKPD
jgi:hypothetical protein